MRTTYNSRSIWLGAVVRNRSLARTAVPMASRPLRSSRNPRVISPRRSVMPETALSGAEFKKQMREGKPKMGLFLNSHSPTVAEQLAYSGYDWLLVDTQHGPMGYEKLSARISPNPKGAGK